jgi:hypothetical protein
MPDKVRGRRAFEIFEQIFVLRALTFSVGPGMPLDYRTAEEELARD